MSKIKIISFAVVVWFVSVVIGYLYEENIANLKMIPTGQLTTIKEFRDISLRDHMKCLFVANNGTIVGISSYNTSTEKQDEKDCLGMSKEAAEQLERNNNLLVKP